MGKNGKIGLVSNFTWAFCKVIVSATCVTKNCPRNMIRNTQLHYPMPMYSILTCWPYHAKYRRLKLDSCDIRRNTYKTCSTCRSIIYDVTFQTLSEQIMSILKERLRTHSMYVGILKEAKLFEQCAKTWQAKIFWVYLFAAATIDTFMHLLRYALSECF